MTDSEIIIIGAGAAGLTAAQHLSKRKKDVTVLEARNRIGGRIHSLHSPEFTIPIELGAEFIHGKLPVTISLLKEMKIKTENAGGEIWRWQDNKIEEETDFVDDYHHELSKKLKALKTDITINKFLNRYFIENKYEAVRYTVRKFVEGYDTADANRASTLAFRDEWLNADWKQFRITGGYGVLMKRLADEAQANGCRIVLSSPVKEIRWKQGNVNVITENKQYIAAKVIITVPLSMLQDIGGHNELKFIPSLPYDKQSALSKLGYGNVVKVILEFTEAFWRNKAVRRRLGVNLTKLGFLFTDEAIPTWWTHYPDEVPILTGWLGGPKAEKLQKVTDESVLQEAIRSLASIFGKEGTQKLRSWKIANWVADPYARGAYSYVVANSKQAINILNQPVADTIFFAGEACSGDAPGTVEAALTSSIHLMKKHFR